MGYDHHFKCAMHIMFMKMYIVHCQKSIDPHIYIQYTYCTYTCTLYTVHVHVHWYIVHVHCINV